MSTAEYHTISQHDLKAFTLSVFKAIGCSDTDASLATDVLIKADLRGIDSHGVARLSGYVRLYENGRINTQPNIHVIREKHSVFTLDGDAGLGLVTASDGSAYVTLWVLVPLTQVSTDPLAAIFPSKSKNWV